MIQPASRMNSPIHSQNRSESAGWRRTHRIADVTPAAWVTTHTATTIHASRILESIAERVEPACRQSYASGGRDRVGSHCEHRVEPPTVHALERHRARGVR